MVKWIALKYLFYLFIYFFQNEWSTVFVILMNWETIVVKSGYTKHVTFIAKATVFI